MKVIITIFIILLTSTSSLASNVLEVENCIYVYGPKLINNGSHEICHAKIECDLGIGPIIFTIACNTNSITKKCPPPAECGQDNYSKL